MSVCPSRNTAPSSRTNVDREVMRSYEHICNTISKANGDFGEHVCIRGSDRVPVSCRHSSRHVRAHRGTLAPAEPRGTGPAGPLRRPGCAAAPGPGRASQPSPAAQPRSAGNRQPPFEENVWVPAGTPG